MYLENNRLQQNILVKANVGILTFVMVVKYICQVKASPCFVDESGQGFIRSLGLVTIWQKNKMVLLQSVISLFEQAFLVI